MWRKWHMTVLLIVAVLVFAVIWLVSKQINNFATAVGCADSLVSSLDAPDGRHVAFVFRRECGATAPDSTQVNVQPADTQLSGEKYKAAVVVDGTIPLKLKWESASQLVVIGITSQRVYRQERVADDGIRIEYIAAGTQGQLGNNHRP